MDKFSKQEGSRIAELIEKGREQGFLTYDDVNDHLPDDISDPDQVEEIIGMINDLGLQVHEKAPDLDTLMLRESENTDDIALEQAAEARSSRHIVDKGIIQKEAHHDGKKLPVGSKYLE